MSVNEKSYVAKSEFIAFDIAFEIMSRSSEPLILLITHPGGGQYNCVTIVKDKRVTSEHIMINISGKTISINGRLFEDYQSIYIKDKKTLLDDISRIFGITLTTNPVRELPALAFLRRLIDERNYDERFSAAAAWYDGDNSFLADTAASFYPYKFKNKENRLEHLPWWVITYSSVTIAMCNIETDEFLSITGKSLNLKNKNERNKAKMEVAKMIPPMYYDRTLRDDFAGLLQEHGRLRWLVDYVKIHIDIDFLIGKNNSGEWISVYRGLTRILRIHD